MTHDAPSVSTALSPAPASEQGSTPTGTPATANASEPSTGRLIGIDLARGLAVFGMYAAHVGPDPSAGGPLGFVLELARGRSSALFALLAGFSLVLITGRPHPGPGGPDGRPWAGSSSAPWSWSCWALP